MIDLVDFVHEQDTRLRFVQQCAKQWAFREEVQLVQKPANGFPIAIDVSCSCFKKDLLQCLVEFSDRLFFVNPDVALQALNGRVRASGNRVSQFGFAGTRRPLDQKRPAHVRGEIDDWKDGLVYDIVRYEQSCSKI